MNEIAESKSLAESYLCRVICGEFYAGLVEVVDRPGLDFSFIRSEIEKVDSPYRPLIEWDAGQGPIDPLKATIRVYWMLEMRHGSRDWSIYYHTQ